MLTKQEILLGRRPGGEQQGEGTQEDALPVARSLGFYDDGISFPVVFGQSF